MMLVGGFFVSIERAQAAISSGSVAGASTADLVVNTADADYDFSFQTNTSAVAEQIFITFPAQFSITDGDLGTSSINDGNGGSPINGRIFVNGVSRTVDNVTGDSGNRKITIVLGTPRDLSVGTISFTMTSGITNGSTAGATGDFTIDTDASGETAQSDVSGVTLTTGEVSYLKITAASGTPTAGATDELTITAYDVNGNVCSAGPYIYEGAKDLTFSGLSNAPDGTVPTVEGTNLGSATSITFTNGVATGGAATLVAYKAESASLDATDGSVSTAGSADYDVDLVVAPGTATEIVFTRQPAGSVSGSALTTQPIVTARDDYENVDTSFTETITLSEDDAGTLSGDVAVAAVAGVATFVDVAYTATADHQTFQLQADDEGALSQITSSDISSNVVATELLISGVSGAPDNAVEFGDDITLTISAVDANDIVDTDEVSTFSITTRTNDDCTLDSTNNTGTLSSGTATITNLNITAADKTAVEFLDGEGIKILVQDTGVGETLTQYYSAGTLTIDYVATKLLVTTQPTGAVDETALTQQPVVKAVDANNNVDTANSSEVITASTATSGAAVGGSTTATMSSGVATFVGLRADVDGTFTDGDNVTLTFNDDGNFDSLGDFSAVNADATALDVVATKLVWTQDPAGCTSGAACSTQGIIVARDAHDNLDSGFADDITIAVKTHTGTGILVGTATQAMTSGSLTTSDIGYEATVDGEEFTLSADDDGTDLTQGVSGTVTADVVATKIVFTTQPSTTVESGAVLAQQPVLEARDDNDVKDTGFTSTITLVTDEAGTLGGTLTENAVAGVADFAGNAITYTNAAIDHETFQLDATAEGVTGATSDSVNPNVTADEIVLTTPPSDAAATNGDVRNAIAFATQPVISYQKDGITDTDVTDTITASLKTGSGTFAGTATEAAVSGVANFSGNGLIYTLHAEENDQQAIVLTFTDDDGNDVDLDESPINSASLTVDVVATALAVGTQPASIVSGVSMTQPVINYVDANSRIDTDISTSDTLTVTENGTGSISSGTTEVVASSGVVTFTDLIYTADADSEAVTFTFTDNESGLDLSGSPVDSNALTADVVATQIVLSTQPTDGAATNGDVRNAIAFATQPIIQYQDADGTVDVDIDNDTVTVSLVNGDGTFGGTKTEAVTNGVADFSGNGLIYTLDTGEYDQQVITLSFADDAGGDKDFSGSDPVTDNSTVDVVATALAFQTAPASIVSGVSMTQPVVKYVDANSRIDTNVTDTTTVTENGTGSISSGTTEVAASSGVVTFTDLIYTAAADSEAVTFTFTDDAAGVNLSGAPLDSSELTADVVATKFLVTLNTNTPVAGVADTLTLTAADANDTTDTGYDPSGLTFSFLDSETNGLASHVSPGVDSPTIPSSATVIAAFGSGTADLATFTLVNAEVLGAITVTDGTLTGDSASITVKHDDASSFTVTPSTFAPDTETTVSVTVTAKDDYGNTADGANGATAFTGLVVLDSTAVSPAWYVPHGNITTSGTKDFTNAVKFQTVESGVTINAQNVGATVTGTSDAITVTQGGDVTPPTISAQYPDNDATDVAIGVDPYVDFSEAMDRTTLTSTNIKLCLVSDADCSSPISAPITISEGDTRAILIVASDLSYNTDYWIYVGTGVKDVAGNALATAYGSIEDSNFTTVAQGDGSLRVTDIDSIESYAAAGGGWPDGDAATADGWSWTFYITVPTTETLLNMKFNDWQSGDNTISVANNMRFYSAQAETAVDSDNAIEITAAGTYSANMTLTGDTSATTAGRQIEVTVEMQIPEGSSGGSYSTSYGVRSNSLE